MKIKLELDTDVKISSKSTKKIYDDIVNNRNIDVTSPLLDVNLFKSNLKAAYIKPITSVHLEELKRSKKPVLESTLAGFTNSDIFVTNPLQSFDIKKRLETTKYVYSLSYNKESTRYTITSHLKSDPPVNTSTSDIGLFLVLDEDYWKPWFIECSASLKYDYTFILIVTELNKTKIFLTSYVTSEIKTIIV